MNKVVLITGATGGLGESLVEIFAYHNYDVIINCKSNLKKANALKEIIENKYGVKGYVYICDISKEKHVEKMITWIKEEIGVIDVLINNAGICLDNEISNKSEEEFRKVIDTNLVGTFLVSKYINVVLKSGTIINVASNQGIKPSYVESIDYDASKAGVISIGHSFALLYHPNIRVNTVAPGWINTKMNNEMSLEFKKQEESKILLKRFAEPKEIARVIYFLASDDASYINDEVIKIDGGIK